MNDEKIIEKTINSYFDGTFYGDENQIRKAFHINARITGFFKGQYCDWSLNEFIERVTTKPTASMKNEKYDKNVIKIEQYHKVAFVKAKVLVGDCYFIDFIILLKINNQWIIRNKSFITEENE